MNNSFMAIMLAIFSSLLNLFSSYSLQESVVILNRFRFKKRSTKISFNKAKFYRNQVLISGKNNSAALSGIITNTRIRIEGENNNLYIEEGCRILNSCIFINGNSCSVFIGKHTTAGSVNIICMGKEINVSIGDFCMFSDNVEIWASDTHPIFDQNMNLLNPSKSVLIGSHVWLGKRAVVMKGVHIGNGAIIGMNTLVTKNVNNNTLNVGIPSKCINENIHWRKCFISDVENI